MQGQQLPCSHHLCVNSPTSYGVSNISCAIFRHSYVSNIKRIVFFDDVCMKERTNFVYIIVMINHTFDVGNTM